MIKLVINTPNVSTNVSTKMHCYFQEMENYKEITDL